MLSIDLCIIGVGYEKNDTSATSDASLEIRIFDELNEPSSVLTDPRQPPWDDFAVGSLCHSFEHSTSERCLASESNPPSLSTFSRKTRCHCEFVVTAAHAAIAYSRSMNPRLGAQYASHAGLVTSSRPLQRRRHPTA